MIDQLLATHMLYRHHIVHLHYYSRKEEHMRRVIVHQLVDLVDTITVEI